MPDRELRTLEGKRMNRILNTLLISGLLSSCASNYRPESFDEKMARYVPRMKQENKVPKLNISPKLMSARSPSSKTKTKGSLALSNKNLYFLTLYSQYKELKKYSVVDHNEIKVCPHFHSLVIDQKDLFSATEKKYTWKFKNQTNIEPTANPVLALPVLSQEVKPSVYELYQKDQRRNLDSLVKKGLQVHVEKTYKEISELCEYGSSDNYYAFENLIGHVKGKGKLESKDKELSTMVKTSLYYNMVLIKFLKKQRSERSISSLEKGNLFDEEILNRSESKWGKQYINAL